MPALKKYVCHQCETRFEEANPWGCEARSETVCPRCGSTDIGTRGVLGSIFNFLREMCPR
ncbi:MAG: hypothetical protein AAGB97_02945 [Dehalococcoidia bacterium]|nr:hypothetical protein [Chloroflexota bacterium]MBT9163083.1 hypothetical protein [Chloroflexota bacterium]